MKKVTRFALATLMVFNFSVFFLSCTKDSDIIAPSITLTYRSKTTLVQDNDCLYNLSVKDGLNTVNKIKITTFKGEQTRSSLSSDVWSSTQETQSSDDAYEGNSLNVAANISQVIPFSSFLGMYKFGEKEGTTATTTGLYFYAGTLLTKTIYWKINIEATDAKGNVSKLSKKFDNDGNEIN